MVYGVVCKLLDLGHYFGRKSIRSISPSPSAYPTPLSVCISIKKYLGFLGRSFAWGRKSQDLLPICDAVVSGLCCCFPANDWTLYIFSTQNQRDFQNLLDVYLDCVFFPQIRELDFM